MVKNLFAVLLLFMLIPMVATAQKRERLKYRADELQVMKIGKETIRKLKYNVVFTQEGTTIYCDSSYFYPEHNRMEAFGRVRIYDDSVTITAKKLTYEGNDRKAFLRQDVVYTSGSMVLYTDFLDYDLVTKVGNFFNKGRLVDQNTVLTSERGIYYSLINYAVFRKDVHLVSPEYTLKSDTLNYNTITKKAVTPGPTHIMTPDGVILDAKGGEYLTEKLITEFDKGEIETRDYILEGDRMYLNDKEKFYTAKGNVKMTAKNRDVIIIGDEGLHYKSLGISKIFGNPVMKKIMERDTFYLSADTLYAIESAIRTEKRILAYHNVKLYRVDMQGKADSLAYFLADSTIELYKDPVLWTSNSQITADSIKLLLVNNIIDKMFLTKNSFMASIDSMKQYNQVKGRNMIAQFEQSNIKEIKVNGNGESIYYVLSDGDTILMGLNKMICSDMLIRFMDNEINDITFYKNPEAKLIPPHEIKAADTRLDGFSWRITEKPALFDVAHYLRPKDETEVLEDGTPPLNKKESAKERKEASAVPSKKEKQESN